MIDPFNLPKFVPKIYDSIRKSKINPGIFQLGASKTAHFAHGYKYIDSDKEIINMNALIRPGSQDLKLEDGKTAAEHYVMRLNGEEEVIYLHPSLEPILKDTYGIILFQEQALFIAQQVAGFDLVKADLMRQAIGKKNFEKMESMRQDFIEGCKIYSDIEPQVAEQIFNEIRASGRYSFNSSHATSYGMIGCIDLWFRYYNPHLFFATQLAYAVDNISDKTKRNRLMKDLIRSAKARNIETVLPSLERRNVHTDFDEETDTIYLGLANIAGAKPPSIRKALEKIAVIENKQQRNILDCPWLEVLLYFSQAIGVTLMDAWIRLGMFDKIDPNRQGLLYDYSDFGTKPSEGLTPAEKRWIADKGFTTLDGAMNGLVQSPVGRNSGCTKESRKTEVRSLVHLRAKNRPQSTGIDWIIVQEQTLLGLSLTLKPNLNEDRANINLSHLGQPIKDAIVAVNVQEIAIKKQKDGRDYCYVSCVDDDGNEGAVTVFADQYSKYGDLLYPNASLLVYGYIPENYPNSVVAKKIERI